MTLQEKLGKAVIKLRKIRGMSQEQFAYAAAIDRKYMSDIENGKRNISIDVLERIANKFFMTVSELLQYAEMTSRDFDDNEGLRKWLCENGNEDTVLLDGPEFANAVVGISENGRLIYSFVLMVECLAEHANLSLDEAVEFIDYNTIRALPYMGEKAPIIMYEADRY